MKDTVISPKDEQDVLARLGLEGNPFLHWDADQEDRLPEYFVPPPYFSAIFGEPEVPASSIAFAPRGGGKSAQRRMVEIQADPEDILVITHADFPFLEQKPPSQVTLDDHLTEIVRHCLVGLIGRLSLTPSLVGELEPSQKTTLQMLATLYLDELTRVELERSLTALKNTAEKLRDFYNKLAFGYNTLGRAALAALEIPAPQLPGLAEHGREAAKNPLTDVQSVGRLALSTGLKAIYVLVDRVDEPASTSNDLPAAYRMISPLIEDLRVLSLPPFSFKFFVPDEFAPLHAEKGRPDRVQQFRLNWKPEEIERMLSKRLSAYSSGRIGSLEEIIDEADAVQWFAQRYLIRFAEQSPRDMVRLLYSILAEQQRMEVKGHRIRLAAITAGIDTFCRDRAKELAPPGVLSELKRLGRADFTISELGSEVFKISTQAARRKIQAWEGRGVVKRIQDTTSTGKRPEHHYCLSDIRLARLALNQLTTIEFWSTKVGVCEQTQCGSTLLRDWDECPTQICEDCGEAQTQLP